MFTSLIGTIGISNMNYTSKLFINEDFLEVQSFISKYAICLQVYYMYSFKNYASYKYIILFFVNSSIRLQESNISFNQQLTQIIREPKYSMEEDFLSQSIYKNISDLKELREVFWLSNIIHYSVLFYCFIFLVNFLSNYHGVTLLS